jgi:hypothetical protein
VGFAILFGAGCGWARVGSRAQIAWLLSVSSLIAVSSNPQVAYAQSDAPASTDASPVVTTVDPCVPVDLMHFRRLLSIELGTSIDYQPSAPREPGRTWVHVACARSGIVLNLEDGLTGKSMARILDASEIEPADSTRLLALAVAEFVVASWVELRAVPRPTVPALGAAPPSAASEVASRTVQRKLDQNEPPDSFLPWELAIGLGIDTFTSHAGVLPTGSLRLQVSLPPLAFVIGGDIGFFDVPVVRGGERAATIDVIRGSGVAAFLFGGDFGDVTFWGGPGVRFGVLRMVGQSQLPNLEVKRLLEAHGGVLLLGRLNHRFTPHFSAGVELEIGVVTLPVQANVDQNVLLEFSGAWVSAGLRASLIF